MYTFLVEDFNVFGMYPFRFIQRNVADGTFFIWLFLLMISIYLIRLLWKTGVMQLAFKLTMWSIKTAVRLVKLACAMTMLAYSLLLLYIESKKLKFSMAEYWQNRTVNTLGVTFKHVSGADDLTVSHPKHILKTLNVLKDVKSRTKDVLYKTLRLVKK